MTVVFGILSVASLLVGWLLLSDSLETFTRRRKMIKRMQTTVGTVIEVHQRIIWSAGSRQSNPGNFPEIKFTTPAGENVTFRSETGDTGETSNYSPGQSIKVLFDPAGVEKPLINSWSGVWDRPLLMGIGGVVFLSAGGGMAWLVINIFRGVIKIGI